MHLNFLYICKIAVSPYCITDINITVYNVISANVSHKVRINMLCGEKKICLSYCQNVPLFYCSQKSKNDNFWICFVLKYENILKQLWNVKIIMHIKLALVATHKTAKLNNIFVMDQLLKNCQSDHGNKHVWKTYETKPKHSKWLKLCWNDSLGVKTIKCLTT